MDEAILIKQKREREREEIEWNFELIGIIFS